MVDRGIPRHDYPIHDEAGNPIGVVTSGTQSPSLGKAIGLGYVNITHSAEGSIIYVMIRQQPVKAVVVKPPFR
jgi:aminomethyltransferase